MVGGVLSILFVIMQFSYLVEAGIR